MTKYKKCHRCGGVGWVLAPNTNTGKTVRCPLCHGKGHNYEVEVDYSKSSSEGCYIATMVYGDYNHPKVIVLRNFRDNVLNRNYLGKFFMKFYYYYSPKFVRKLENKININNLIRKALDKLVKIVSHRH